MKYIFLRLGLEISKAVAHPVSVDILESQRKIPISPIHFNAKYSGTE